MSDDTFIPPRTLVKHGDRTAALDYLGVRLGLNMTVPFRDVADRRHEIAVLAVDIASRLIWLHAQIAEAAMHGSVELAALSNRATARQTTAGTAHDDVVVSPIVERLPHLASRVQELEYALNLVAGAFRAAWHADAPAPTV